MEASNDLKTQVNFFRKISVRVTVITLVILLIGIGSTVTYYLNTQYSTIIESREDAIKDINEIVYRAIKNNMLAGEAPIAMALFEDFAKITVSEDKEGQLKSKPVEEVKLYRANGEAAFSDNKTVNTVNKNLGDRVFISKKESMKKETIKNKNFDESVKNITDVFVEDFKENKKSLISYKPLINQPKCSSCHGLDHVVRGIIKISSSVDKEFEKASNNVAKSIILYVILLIILTSVIILFLRSFVILRIFSIGNVVQGVGEGDFKTKIPLQKTDEIGLLAKQINKMIDGLNERFKLSKFVSKSTLDHVKESGEISLGGEKKVMTVLFSDIRGFTNYSESRMPDEVMKVLNEVMILQGKIIHEFGGDIDKFVGDELMAVFEGDDMVIRAAKAAEKIISTMKEKFSTPGRTIHVGIGINTGEMISGNMGSGERLDRTVIGDSVNLGARLCSAAGKNTIVISEFSYDYIKDEVVAREHDPIKVKGKKKPVKIYTLRRTQ